MPKPIKTRTYDFPDEGTLNEVLAGEGPSAPVRARLEEHLSAGEAVIVSVAGQPPRAVVRKRALEELLGQQIQGADLQAIPFG